MIVLGGQMLPWSRCLYCFFLKVKLETETIVLVDLVSAAAACKLENCNLFMCLPVLVTLYLGTLAQARFVRKTSLWHEIFSDKWNSIEYHKTIYNFYIHNWPFFVPGAVLPWSHELLKSSIVSKYEIAESNEVKVSIVCKMKPCRPASQIMHSMFKWLFSLVFVNLTLIFWITNYIIKFHIA